MRLELAQGEAALLCDCIERRCEPLAEDDSQTELALALSVIYVRLLTAMRDELAADKAARDAEWMA